ncbi:DUF2637 domain-containing protein [Streptomyces sp. NPDC059708]|uniref:DUF2637 domain-containing protein n=1 Tax=Streptomyces sp. NPDC059708 TaxID=3346916 RepID=UPI003673FC7F
MPAPAAPASGSRTADQYVLAAAGCVIVALTATGFWLSYAHLAEVAGQHGLDGSPARKWAWPATLDAFIVSGELLMLRAGLRRTTDWWAIVLTAAGSLGSIALNVAGVSGAHGTGNVPTLDYVVAAIPPAAALVAFGALMRQVHQRLVDPEPTHRHTPNTGGGESPSVAASRSQGDAPVRGPHPDPDLEQLSDPPHHDAPRVPAADGPQEPECPLAPPRKVGRPKTGEEDELFAVVTTLDGKPSPSAMRTALREADHTVSNERLGILQKRLIEHRAQSHTETPAGR